MKPVLRFLSVAVPTLAVGFVAGAAVGIAAFEKAYGPPAFHAAAQAANYAFLLKSRKAANSLRAPDDVIGEAYDRANSSLVLAAQAYDDLEPHVQEMLVRVVDVLDKHPLAGRDVSGDVVALYAREARACINRGGTPVAIAGCARREVARVRMLHCPERDSCMYSSVRAVTASDAQRVDPLASR